jgi:hypothetical protein
MVEVKLVNRSTHQATPGWNYFFVESRMKKIVGVTGEGSGLTWGRCALMGGV